MQFGSLELDGAFGSMELVNEPVTSLPQGLASALGNVNAQLLGATYMPLWYIGRQVVNGINHYVLCKQIRSTKDKDQQIVVLVVNVPPQKVDKGDGATIVEIIEEAKMDATLHALFDSTMKQLLGMSYKPVAYIGKQVVRGINYHFICEAKRIYPGAKPFAVVIVINSFKEQNTIVSIEQIEHSECVNAPLGEWP